MAKDKVRNWLVLTLLVLVFAPSFALAAWWNPFSWGVWNRVFHFQRTEQKQEKQGNQTAGWKIYTNANYGFEFEYPGNWYVDEPAHSIYVTDPLVEVSLDDEKIDYSKRFPLFTIGIRKTEFKNINIPTDAENYVFASKEAKFSCLKDKEKIGMCTIVLAHGSNTFYVISNGVDFRSDKVLSQIVSTFKFTK